MIDDARAAEDAFLDSPIDAPWHSRLDRVSARLSLSERRARVGGWRRLRVRALCAVGAKVFL